MIKVGVTVFFWVWRSSQKLGLFFNVFVFAIAKVEMAVPDKLYLIENRKY